MKRYLFIIACWSTTLFSQVLTWDPLFPTAQDTITIVYDASLGNGELAGASAVYAHTGVITDKSTHPTEWRYVKTDWGENTPETRLGNRYSDFWSITIPIQSYYNVPETETITALAFVFRNSDGSRVGRTADGGDFFIPIYQDELNVTLVNPTADPCFVETGDTIQVEAMATSADTLTLFLDGVELYQTTGLRLLYDIEVAGTDRHTVQVKASDTSGSTKSVAFDYIVNPEVINENFPENILDGIHYEDDQTVTLSLFAPNKEFVYLLGDFNQWEIDSDYFMHYSPADSIWWMTLTDLKPGREYTFQYLVDGLIRIADPYAKKVLDPWNDQSIPSSVYPDLIAYPAGKTSEIVSVFQTAQVPYDWQVTDFQRPPAKDLVIYEMLLRDFIANHDYATLIDTLDYFSRLGINAIELMPVNEFEGNSSWGYNSSFYFALDKYYGPEEDFCRFVDEAHQRGIAVIIDAVLNHVYGQNPWVRLYATQLNESPWFNETAPHTDFSWGYDFNHEKYATQRFVDRFTRYWLEEYKIDGFRFDFTRGFTNKPGSSGPYDASRIDILKRMYDQIVAVDSSAYVILEHLVDNNTEMRILANYGMLLWGNMYHPYSQSAMGWLEDNSNSSSLSNAYFRNRSWSLPHLVAYMESHDEDPPIMYKNLNYGKSGSGYNIQNLSTALERMELVSAFFFPIPGPKMIWQFGELGYDRRFPDDRLSEKAILWNYYEEPDRLNLFETFSALIRLRNEHDIFRSAETQVDLRVGQGQYDRRIKLTCDTMKVSIIGNFNVSPMNVQPEFHHTGIWYDYFSGDSLMVNDTEMAITLPAGAFKIYSDIALETPVMSSPVKSRGETPHQFVLHPNFPNPFNPSTQVRYSLEKESWVTLEIYNLRGEKVKTLVNGYIPSGEHQQIWKGMNDAGHRVASGVYLIQLRTQNKIQSHKMLLIK